MNMSTANINFLFTWSEIQSLHKNQKITDHELVGFFLILWSLWLKPKTWKGPTQSNLLFVDHSFSQFTIKESLDIFRKNSAPEVRPLIQLLKNIPAEKKWLQWCSENFLQTTPHATISALKSWAQFPDQLQLMSYVPSPEKVLILQSQGTRCLSLVYNESAHNHIVANGKNSFEFLTHDLIHADRFYRNPESAAAQRFFCKNILMIYHSPEIQTALQSCPEFRERFEYLTSDMNSHLIHLLKTFRALIDSNTSKNSQSPRPLTWSWIQTQWTWTEPVRAPFLHLNSDLETSLEHEQIFKTALSHLK